jgi:hypothetical protein
LKPYGVCYNTVTKIIVAGEVAHGMVQGVDPEFKPQYHKEKKNSVSHLSPRIIM